MASRVTHERLQFVCIDERTNALRQFDENEDNVTQRTQPTCRWTHIY
jgi:hypothetical protein